MHTFRKDRKTTTVLRERVAALSKKELRERASRNRRRAMLLWAALGSALAVLFTLLFGGLPLWLGTESPSGTALAIAGGVALGVTLLPFFGLFATLRRTDEDLVLRALRGLLIDSRRAAKLRKLLLKGSLGLALVIKKICYLAHLGVKTTGFDEAAVIGSVHIKHPAR